MQIFLLILKVLGILILSILGILILFISLILFVPVRYQIEGKVEEDFKFCIRGKITWLLSIAAIRFSYIESEFLHEIRIFGMKWKKRQKDNIEDSEDEISEEQSDVTNKVLEAGHKDAEPEITYSDGLLERLEEKRANQKEASVAEENVRSENETETKAAQNTKPKKSWFYKLAQKMKTFFTELKLKLTKLLQLLKNIKEKISDIKAVISDETNKKAVALLWKEIKYLLHHFKFRRIDTDLTFGTDDPANTGQILGVICLFPILYQYNFHLYPDFEADKLYVKGDFKIAGRVRIIHIVVSLIRLIKEKEMRTFIKKWLSQN